MAEERKPIMLDGSDQGKEPAVANIFSAKKEAPQDTKMMETILSRQIGTKAKPILGNAPTLQKSIEKQKTVNLRKKLRLIQSLLVFVALMFGLTALYFYSQLSPKFDLLGQNTTLELQDVNSKLGGLQTQLNKYRYLALQLDLNSFSFAADEFMDKASRLSTGRLSATTSQILNTDLTQLSQDLSSRLGDIKDKITPPLVIETFRSEAEERLSEEELKSQFEVMLKETLNEERKKLIPDSELSEVYRQDVKLYDNVLKLVGNMKLYNTITRASLQKFDADLSGYVSTLDAEKGKELRDLMGGVLSSTKNDLATIGLIKASRIQWADIIDQISQSTIKIDTGFGNRANCEISFCIVYTGYEFDTSANRIALSGFIRTNDKADNFTRITKLIDELERSPYFESVEMRSFAKSGNFSQGFSANFKIDLGVEQNGVSILDQAAHVVKQAIAQTARTVGKQMAVSRQKVELSDEAATGAVDTAGAVGTEKGRVRRNP